ncbi:MAG: mRNA interferase YafQ [Parvicella sp.]|jgi:mRNA interferase YafQ
MEEIKKVIALLADEIDLPKSYLDHPLKGNWIGCRDLNIEPDWVLIYRTEGGLLRFERTGTHLDLF